MSTSTSGTSPLSTIKHRQIAHLSQQLALLSQRTEHLERLTVTTAEQASYMRLLGGYHAAWFMSAGRIMTPGEDQQQMTATTMVGGQQDEP